MHPRVHPKLADLCSIRLVRLESGIPIRRMPNAPPRHFQRTRMDMGWGLSAGVASVTAIVSA